MGKCRPWEGGAGSQVLVLQAESRSQALAKLGNHSSRPGGSKLTSRVGSAC